MNYGDRYRHGEPIASAFVESAVSQAVSKRFVKRQQMDWGPRHARNLLQIRTAVLNSQFRSYIERWYPSIAGAERDRLTAWPAPDLAWSPYTSVAFGQRCLDVGVRPSMSSVGDAYDNAMCESFFATLECELLNRSDFATHDEARQALFSWIEGWYNSHRLPSALGYRFPQELEKLPVGVRNPPIHRAYTAPSQGENPST